MKNLHEKIETNVSKVFKLYFALGHRKNCGQVLKHKFFYDIMHLCRESARILK